MSIVSDLLFFVVVMMMSSTTTAAALTDMNNPLLSHSLKRILSYELPTWAKGYLLQQQQQQPKEQEPLTIQGRIPLANLPTPLHQVLPTSNKSSTNDSVMQKFAQKGISFYIKRDDMSGGVELGGNKIRKLEFLLADALKKGCDSVVTIGGEQSNHCRATAAAARMVGLEPHLILRTKRAQAVLEGTEDFGMCGNILFDRIVGSTIYTCTPGEYGRVGSGELVKGLCEHLESSNGGLRKPYGIPVGGSNALGSFGYIEAVDELITQWQDLAEDGSQVPPIDHIVFACGSGGTAAGIAVGTALAYGALESKGSGKSPTVHAIGVCDNPDYFYRFVAKIADEMGLTLPSDMSTEVFIRQHLIVHQGKGLGYAVSTDDELDFVTQFAQDTGIALDPVYSGKALYNFVSGVIEGADADSFSGKNVLFWHTGGALGLYDKGDNLLKRLTQQSPIKRLDVYGKGTKGTVDIHSSDSLQ